MRIVRFSNRFLHKLHPSPGPRVIYMHWYGNRNCLREELLELFCVRVGIEWRSKSLHDLFITAHYHLLFDFTISFALLFLLFFRLCSCYIMLNLSAVITRGKFAKCFLNWNRKFVSSFEGWAWNKIYLSTWNFLRKLKI